MSEIFVLIVFIIFLLSLHIQLLFFLVVFSRLIRYKEKKDKLVQKGISVIVCAHNELFNLRNLIPHLLRQDYPDFEVVIVNDRSDDGTLEYLRENFSKESKIRILNIEDFDLSFHPKKYALTLGIRLAEKELIVVTDADCIPVSRNWLKELASAFIGKTELVLGYAPYFRRKGLLNKVIRFETFYTGIQYLSLAVSGLPYMGVGRNLAYTKRLFLAEGGLTPYEHITGGDDDLFVQKVANSDNVNITICEDSHTASLPKSTIEGWFKQKKRHLSVGKYYKFKVRFILGMLTISHLLFYVSFIFLLFTSWWFLALLGWGLRSMVIIFIFASLSNKLKENFAVVLLPLLDFLYILNYTVAGITAVFSRQVKWK